MDVNINTTERLQHAEADLYDQYDHIDPWVVVSMRYKDGAVIRLFVESEDDLQTWIRVLEDAHARLRTARQARHTAALAAIGCDEHGPECVTAGDHAEFAKLEQDTLDPEFYDNSRTAEPGNAIFDVVDEAGQPRYLEGDVLRD
jgi:hypothetical protein